MNSGNKSTKDGTSIEHDEKNTAAGKENNQSMTKDEMSNEHDEKNTAAEKEDNQSMTKDGTSNEHDIEQSSEFETPASTNQIANKFGHKIESSLTNKDNSSNRPRKKSKFKHETVPPTCPSCDNLFVMDFGNSKSPVMSMNCEHTICYSCVQHHVEKNQKKLNRSTINVCSCPIKSCGAKRSFNAQSCNYNAELILFYELIERKKN